MKSQKRLYRILKIITLLSSGYKKWTAGDLAELFNVSVRTIHRDKEIMEEMGIPLYYDTGKNTYSILESFYFNPPNISRDETMALLLVAQAFEEDSFPYREELDTVISKILNSLPPSLRKLFEDIEDKISYRQGASVDLSPYKEFIDKAKKAIEECNSIKINYYSLSSDIVRERMVNPYSITMKNGACYLIGYCHFRSEIRLFRMDRINELDITRDIFERPNNYSIEDYLHNAWGVERSDKNIKVKVIFSGPAAQLVKEMNWHPSQRITKLSDHKIKFEVLTGSFKEIKSWILGFGSSVEVIEPEELKEAVKQEIGKMQKIYG